MQKKLQGLQKSLRDNRTEQKSLSKEIKDADKEIKQIEKTIARTGTTTEEQRKRLEQLRHTIETDRTSVEALKLQEAQLRTQIEDTNKRIEDERKALADLKTSMGDAKSAAGELTKEVAAIGAAATAAVAGLFAFTKDAAQWADDINTLSKVTGISTAELQKFTYATNLIDVAVDTLSGSLTKLTRNMAEPSKTAAAAFDTLKVKTTDATGALRDRQEVFYEIIDALGKVGNEVERDALCMDIFGKSAQQLNPLIKGGAEALKEIGDRAERAGLILSQETLNGLNAFNDKVDELRAKGTAIKELAAAEMTPALEGLVEVGDELLTEIQQMVQSGELKGMAKELGQAIKNGAEGLKNIISFVWKYKEAIGAAVVAMVAFKVSLTITSLINSLVTGMKALSVATRSETTAMAALNTVMNANPIGIVISLVAALTFGLGSLAAMTSKAERSFKNYNEELERMLSQEKNVESEAIKEGKNLQLLKDEYDRLREKTSLTVYQKEKLNDIAQQLANTLGLTTNELKNQEGAYRDLTGEIDNYVESLKNQAKLKYYTELVAEAYTQILVIQDRIDKLNEARKKAFETDGQAAMSLFWDEIGDLNAQLEAAKKAYEDAQKKYDQLNISVESVSGTFKKYTDISGGARKSTEELTKQSASLRSEMSSLASTMQQLEEGQALTLDTVLDLIDKYPELGAELLAAGDNADLQRMALEKLFEAKKADYILTQQKAIDNIDASNRETEATIKNIEQQIKMYQMLGGVGAAVNKMLHPEMTIGDALSSALNPLVLSAELTGLQAQLDRNNAIKAGLESKIAAARSMNYSDLYKPSSSGSGSGGSSGMTAEEKRLSEAQSLALAAFKKLVDGKIELYEKESKAAKDSADKQIAALDAVMKKRNEEKEDAKRQQELAIINAKLTYKQLDDFTRHELERRRQDILNEQYEVDYSRNIEAQKAAINAGAVAIQDRNAAAIAGLNTSKTQVADRMAYIAGNQTYDQRVANNSKVYNIQIVRNGFTDEQLIQLANKTIKELG